MDWNILISSGMGALVGSSLTLIATLISHNLQCSNQNKKENELICGLLQSIHDEIKTLWEVYNDGMGNCLEALEDGQPLKYYYPITQEYFTVYTTNAILIGKIKDHDLRKNIISTYTKAKGLIDSYRMNNDLVYKYEHSYWRFQETNSPIHRSSMNAHHQALVKYAKGLKETHNDVKQKVQNLLGELEKEVLNK